MAKSDFWRQQLWTFSKYFLSWAPVWVAASDLVATIIKVEGLSMYPTLNGSDAPAVFASSPVSDWILVEKVSYKWFHKYARGDIAVLWAPDEPHQQIIKRVVALEHDVVWDDENKATMKIPKGRCWVEGDNPPASGDSRNMYGPVHLGLLEGRATHVIWPPWRWAALPQRYPRDRIAQESRPGA